MNEVHVDRPQGWWFPISLIDLYQSGTLNAEEMMLLGKITVLQDKDKGCFASNTYLAEWWSKSPDHVSDTIAKFAGLGLISSKVSKRRGNRRRMFCTYAAPGLSGKIPRAREEKTGSLRGKDRVHNTITSEHKQKRNCPRKESLRSSPVSADGGIFDFGDEVPPFVKTVVNKLEEYVRSSHRMNGRRFNRKRWYEDIRLLLVDIENDKPRLKQVLSTFLSTPHTNYTPRVASAAAFREKFHSIEKWACLTEPHRPKSGATCNNMTPEEFNQQYEDNLYRPNR